MELTGLIVAMDRLMGETFVTMEIKITMMVVLQFAQSSMVGHVITIIPQNAKLFVEMEYSFYRLKNAMTEIHSVEMDVVQIVK